jgi:hypothetical protein
MTALAQEAPSTATPARAGSNSLPDLAARIRVEHEATSVALKSSVEHAIVAGELLIEAKALVQHGQWLPWLAKNCALSERTAQLYMRCAKNRSAIEEQIRNDVADLTLNEAAAILMLSSDVRKLLAFAKRVESADPEELIAHCAAEGIAVIKSNPFGAKDFSGLEDAEQLEWFLWVLFGVKELRVSAEEASYHADRLQSRGWSLAEWYGDPGDSYRCRCIGREIPQSAKNDWHAFLASNRGRTIDDVRAEIDQLDEARVARLGRAGKPRRAGQKVGNRGAVKA